MADILSDVSAGIKEFYLRSPGFANDATLQTFRRRASDIADHAHNSRGALGEGVEFLRGLDETERQCRPS